MNFKDSITKYCSSFEEFGLKIPKLEVGSVEMWVGCSNHSVDCLIAIAGCFSSIRLELAIGADRITGFMLKVRCFVVIKQKLIVKGY